MKADELEKKYLANVETYKSAIKAWQNVKRVSKKDGSDFANFSKNFVNANIYREYYWSSQIIRVDYQYNHGWTHDTIDVNDNDSVNDIFDKINKRIELFRDYIANNERKAQNTEQVFREVDRSIKELVNFCKEKGFSAYEVCDYIHDNCRRL